MIFINSLRKLIQYSSPKLVEDSLLIAKEIIRILEVALSEFE